MSWKNLREALLHLMIIKANKKRTGTTYVQQHFMSIIFASRFAPLLRGINTSRLLQFDQSKIIKKLLNLIKIEDLHMQKINFYFDFLSPYSYFAWTNHKASKQRQGIDFTYKPVLMGKLFSHHEFPGPGMIKAKRNYELKSCFRYAAKENIEFTPPEQFPFNPLAIIRLATNAAATDKQARVIDFIFKQVWAKGKVLEDPEHIEELLKEAGFESEIIERSFSKDAKIELKQNIKDAISADIFGVPSFQINDEFFWGNDSLTYLDNYLDGNDIWDKELYNELLRKN